MTKNNTYTKRFFCVCPSDNDNIEYLFVLQTDRKVMVEDINSALEKFEQAYHEDIADSLFDSFGGRQQLTAEHQGVAIVTTRF